MEHGTTRPRRHGADSTALDLDDALDTLNRMVRRQWQIEAALRQLQDPSPITVHWRPSHLEITDHQGVVRGSIIGRTDEVEALAAALLELKWRRMVVLGVPGSGKTTLAVLLTLALTARRQRTDPVPVLLSMSSWRPGEEHLHAWIRRRIAEDYPTLTDKDRYGGTAISDIVADRRVLPILDGLDELPAAHRPAALRAINRAAAEGDPVVVTSRLAEYEDAVAVGDVLTGAVVIQAQPVRVEDAIAYLQRSTPPGTRSQRWTPAFDELTDAPDGPLATALSSPLAVVMTRLVYPESRDPTELTDRSRFPDATTIENHLLDALVPSLLQSNAQQDGPAAPRMRTWDPAAVRRWLTFLAGHAHALGTYDIAWWRLHESVPALTHRTSRAAIAGAIAGFVAAVLFTVGTVPTRGLSAGLLTGIKHGLAYGLGTLAAGLMTDLGAAARRTSSVSRRRIIANILRTGIAGGAGMGCVHLIAKIIEYRAVGPPAVVGLAYGLGLLMMFGIAPAVAAVPGPTRTNLRLRGRGRLLLHHLGSGLLLGAVAGLALGGAEQAVLMLAKANDVFIEDRLVFGFLPGLVFGLVPGMASEMIIWARAPIALEEASSPRSTLGADRRQYVALIGMLTAVAVVSFALAAVLSLEGGLRAAIGFGVFGGLGGSTVIALVLGFTAAWPRYALARVWLAAHHRLPWRLATFLDEAQRIGILRQVGATYQFRHANLQDRLAADIHVADMRYHGYHSSRTRPLRSNIAQALPASRDA